MHPPQPPTTQRSQTTTAFTTAMKPWPLETSLIISRRLLVDDPASLRLHHVQGRRGLIFRAVAAGPAHDRREDLRVEMLRERPGLLEHLEHVERRTQGALLAVPAARADR